MFNLFRKRKKMREVGKEELSDLLKEKSLVFLYFEAPWCGSCKMLHPILNDLADENREKENFCIAFVNVDEGKELAREFNILSVPQLAIFKDGKKVFQGNGMISKPRTQEMIDSYLS